MAKQQDELVRLKIEQEPYEEKTYGQADDEAEYTSKPEKDHIMMEIPHVVKEPLNSKLLTIKPQFNANFHEFDYPSFALSFPHFIDNKVPNNFWIEDMAKKGEDVVISREKAYYQFLELYNVLNSVSLVHLVPAKEGLQDLVYTANLGLVLPQHIKQNTFIVSNFRSSPRVGEAQVGYDFFKMMGFDVIQAPNFFEGYADIKWLYENIFIGGYNIRTNKQTYKWMEENFDVKIVPIYMEVPELYHFDCQFFNIDGENSLVYVDGMYDDDIEAIEEFTNVIEISEDDAFSGSTNSIRAGSLVINSTNLKSMKKTDEYYEMEKKRVETFADTIIEVGLEPVFVDLSEFMKSGALASCMALPLNYVDYPIA